jgi:hypothetical protein
MVTMGPPQGVRPGDILEVLHEFGGRGEDELIMLPHDKIKLIELDEGFGDAWYYGKNLRTGQTGLFPASMRPPQDRPHHPPTIPPANISPRQTLLLNQAPQEKPSLSRQYS